MVTSRLLLPSTHLVPFFDETAHHHIGVKRIRFKWFVRAAGQSNDEPQPPTNRCSNRDARRPADNAAGCSHRRSTDETKAATSRGVGTPTRPRFETSGLSLLLTGIDIVLRRLGSLKLKMSVRPQQWIRSRACHKT